MRGSNKGTAQIKGTSRGEREVIKALKKHRVQFYRETKFKDCRGETKPLAFDFSIYVNGEMRGLIEFDGVQHFIPSFTVEEWERLRAADEVKEQFCKDNELPLLRIPFHKFKCTEDMVRKFLLEIGAIKRTPRGGYITLGAVS